MDTIKNVLNSLGLSASEQVVYLSLLKQGEATARTLASRTGITRPSVYDQIKQLRSQGLVAERAIEGKTYFAVSDVRKLEMLLSEKIEHMEEDRLDLNANLSELLATTQSVQPKIRFFEGRNGAQQLLKDMLWHDNIMLSVYWPYQDMIEVLGEEYLEWFNAKRVKRNIAVKTIWQKKDKRKKKHVFQENDEHVERRYSKSQKRVDMGYMIYDDKTAFISSSKEAFGFIVESVEYADLMRMQFDTLWKDTTK